MKKIVIKTKISSNLSWLEKYLIRAKHKMPSLKLPAKIRSYRPSTKKEMRNVGACVVNEKLLTISTHTQLKRRNPTGRRSGVRYRIIKLSHHDILLTLAHELSHLQYHHHNYEQEAYARTIFDTFGLKEKCPYCDGKGKIPAPYENH